MKEIWINRQSTIAYTPVKVQEFYARKVTVTDEQSEEIDKIISNWKALSKWSAEVYSGLNTRNAAKLPDFPQELDSGKEKQKTNTSKKGGAKKRVRDGSSGDATHAESQV
jgi:hypothetical protein